MLEAKLQKCEHEMKVVYPRPWFLLILQLVVWQGDHIRVEYYSSSRRPGRLRHLQSTLQFWIQVLTIGGTNPVKSRSISQGHKAGT